MLVLTACGGGNGDADATAPSNSDGTYPVTVETEYGEITVTEKPERIVVVNSPIAVDVLAALDEPPVIYGSGFEDVAAQFDEARARLAGLQGATYFVAHLNEDGSFYTFPPADRFLGELGLEPADNMPVPPESPTDISAENLDDISADVVLLTGPPQDGSDRFVIEDDPRYAELPAVDNGTMIFLHPLVGDVPPTQIGPASVPWYLDRFLPELENSSLNTSE